MGPKGPFFRRRAARVFHRTDGRRRRDAGGRAGTAAAPVGQQRAARSLPRGAHPRPDLARPAPAAVAVAPPPPPPPRPAEPAPPPPAPPPRTAQPAPTPAPAPAPVVAAAPAPPHAEHRGFPWRAIAITSTVLGVVGLAIG